MKQLTDREKQIKELREKGETLEAIGFKFGITRERVRQICKKLGLVPSRPGFEYTAPEPTYRNAVAINEDGTRVALTDSINGNRNWVVVTDKRLIKAIRSIYNLEMWIPA